MENASNTTSRQELEHLRSEGKINQTEYRELLEAMNKPAPGEPKPTAAAEPQFEAFRVRLLTGEQVEMSDKLVDSHGNAITAEETTLLQKEAEQRPEQLNRAARNEPTKTPITIGTLLLDLALGIAALVLGIISWPNAYGKATVMTLTILGFLMLLIAALGP